MALHPHTRQTLKTMERSAIFTSTSMLVRGSKKSDRAIFVLLMVFCIPLFVAMFAAIGRGLRSLFRSRQDAIEAEAVDMVQRLDGPELQAEIDRIETEARALTAEANSKLTGDPTIGWRHDFEERSKKLQREAAVVFRAAELKQV